MSSYEKAVDRFRRKGKPLSGARQRALIPPLVIKAMVNCPECGEPFPVRIRLLGMKWAVDYPMRKLPKHRQNRRQRLH